MKPVFLLFFLLPFLFQCNRTTYTSADFPADYLTFGSGGGYSGEVTTYFVLPNGQVFQHSSLGSDTLAYTQISKRSAKSLMDDFTSLGLDTLNFYHPGNMYRFVEKYRQDEVVKLSMGDQQMLTPPVLKDYYQALSETIKAAAEKTADQ
jgi:hypothetical protein